MTRDDFEQWVEDNKDEALDRIERDSMSLPQWVKLFGKALQLVQAEEEGEEDEDEDDYADVDEPLNFDEEDM